MSANLADIAGEVYVLHLQLGTAVRHYVGFSRRLPRRIATHQSGHGAHPKFVQAGGLVLLGDSFEGTMADEQELAGRLGRDEAGRSSWPQACWLCAAGLEERIGRPRRS